jgi:3-deoxy-D-manno-octulosonic-acid transferase
MFNFTDISQVLLKKGAAIQVEDAAGLKAAVEDLINNPDKRNEMGMAAKHVIEENKGASARNAQLIRNLL